MLATIDTEKAPVKLSLMPHRTSGVSLHYASAVGSGECLRWQPLANERISATGLKTFVNADLFERAPWFGFMRTSGYTTIAPDADELRTQVGAMSMDLSPGVVAVFTLWQYEDFVTVVVRIMLLDGEADFDEGPAFGLVKLASGSRVQLWLSSAVDPTYCVTAGNSVKSTATIAF